MGVIKIIVEGNVAPEVVEEVLSEAGVDARRGSQSRGVGSALSWVVSAASLPSKVASRLVDGAATKLVGSTVKVQVGDRVVEVTNLNRNEVREMLDRAAEIAEGDKET